jgi:hypothetical protein
MKFYDWRKLLTTINNVPVTNWAEGDDVFQAERVTPSASMVIGVDGKATVSLSADKSIKVTIKLAQTSPTNAYLSQLAAGQDHLEGFTPITVQQYDTYRRDSVESMYGYIEKPANVTRGGKANAVEWVMYFEEGAFILGDPVFTGQATGNAEALG